MDLKAGRKKSPEWTVAVMLLVVCLAAFGLLLPRLGYFWDDWAKILVSRLFGLSGYWAYYAEDRPISGWTHILLTPLLGVRPLAWQIFALLMRWLTAVGIWWTLRLLWPTRRKQAIYGALLFAVYPVFTQQPIALTFHQQWLQYALYFLSAGLMILAVRKPQRFWLFTGLALAGMVAELTITEYFVGLEALRLLFLWLLAVEATGSFRRRATTFLRYAWPYLALLAAYVIWRLFFIQLTGEDPYKADLLFNLFSRPLSTLQTLARMVVSDTAYVLLGSWAGVVSLGLELENSLTFTLLIWAIAIATGALVVVYLLRLPEAQAEEAVSSRWSWTAQALVIGLVGTMLGCLPGWITNRPVIFDFHSNRYAMPAMFGAALVWAAVLDWLVQRRLQKNVLLGAMVTACTLFHLYTAGDYARIWEDQLNFYWQLYWRAPYLEQDTALLGENELFPNQGSFSTSAAINLLYPQDAGRENLAYWYYNLWPRFAIEPSQSPLGIPLRTQFRTLTYEGTTGKSVVIYYEPGKANCLWVLGPEDALNPDLPLLTRRMLPASDLTRIHTEPVSADYPDRAMYGVEPAHTWCYFYQKAALARQAGDWVQVAQLADQARSNPEYYPQNPWFKTPHEWIPFIQGYAMVGRWHDAQELAIPAANVYQVRYREEFCSMWDKLLRMTSPGEERDAATLEVETALNCEKK